MVYVSRYWTSYDKSSKLGNATQKWNTAFKNKAKDTLH